MTSCHSCLVVLGMAQCGTHVPVKSCHSGLVVLGMSQCGTHVPVKSCHSCLVVLGMAMWYSCSCEVMSFMPSCVGHDNVVLMFL